MSRKILAAPTATAALTLCSCATTPATTESRKDIAPFQDLQLSSNKPWGGSANGTSALTALFKPTHLYPLADADFLGTNQKTLREQEGRCEQFASAANNLANNKPVAQEFQALLSNPTHAKGRVFAILLPTEKNIVGYGVFDAEGRARCTLSPGVYVASTGFGDSRVETGFEVSAQATEPPSIKIRLRETGRVVLVPGNEQGISPGDMVRIGRTPLPDSTLLFPDASLARSIESDLFKPVQSTEENNGVSEYLTTTLFVSETPLTLDLEEGFYHFALYSGTTSKQCLAKISVQKEATQYLRCDSSDSSLLDESISDTKIDATSLDAATYEKWEKSGLFKKHRTRFLSLPSSERNSFAMGHILFPRTFDAEGLLDAETACRGTLDSFTENKHPLAGTGEERLANGTTPFWVNTASQFPLDSDERLTEAFYFLTNGAIITFSGITDGLLWPPLSQQRLRAVLKIPLGNNTSQMSLYVNRKEHRRITLQKENTWAYSRVVIDEPIAKREDFTLAICAWGRTALPEFIIGTRDVLPLLVTRPVCVDADGDGRCNTQQQGE